MSDRFGFRIGFLALAPSSLSAAINPEAAKQQNADVPGFRKTGFSRVPLWGYSLAGLVTVAPSGVFGFDFNRRFYSRFLSFGRHFDEVQRI
jgi:hypothetical protein